MEPNNLFAISLPQLQRNLAARDARFLSKSGPNDRDMSDVPRLDWNPMQIE